MVGLYLILLVICFCLLFINKKIMSINKKTQLLAYLSSATKYKALND
jgi:hypothetical protein